MLLNYETLNRHTDRLTKIARWTNRQTGRQDRNTDHQTDTYTNRWTVRQTDISKY